MVSDALRQSLKRPSLKGEKMQRGERREER